MIPTQVTPNRQNYVEIGKIYENLVTEVVFSVPDLGDGTGSYTVVFQRPKEAAPYPVAARVEWPNVIWEVGAADTAKSGTGKAEVRWYGDDGEVGKSKTFIVRVNAGLADPTEAPEAWEGYVGRVARNAETAETAAADAAASAQSAGADAVKAEAALKALEDGIASGDFRGEDGAVPNIQIGTVTTLPAGSDATASMGGTAENPLLNLGIPKGADGTGSGQIRKLGSLTLEEPVSTVEISIPGGANEVWVHFYNVYDPEISAKLGILRVNGKSVILGQNLPLDSINQQIAMHLLILTDGIGYASVSSGSQSTSTKVAVGFAPCGWGAAYNGDFGDTISRVAFSQSDPSKSFAPGCMMDVWGR